MGKKKRSQHLRDVSAEPVGESDHRRDSRVVRHAQLDLDEVLDVDAGRRGDVSEGSLPPEASKVRTKRAIAVHGEHLAQRLSATQGATKRKRKPASRYSPEMVKFLDEFGRRLKGYREARGLKQTDLAKSVGVHPITISSWERGKSEPPASKLILLAAALRVSPLVLMGKPKESTVQAVEAYLSSAYHQTLVEEGRPLSDVEIEAMGYLVDSLWIAGTPTPRALHRFVDLIRTTAPEDDLVN